MISRLVPSLALTILWPAASQAMPVDFATDIRPILESHCYECHGENKQKSGLRLDIRQAALTGGFNHGPDIVPGNAADSPLIHFLTHADDDKRMPPDEPLEPAQIELLTRWIDEGAHWPDGIDLAKLEDKSDHWSFKPLRDSAAETRIDSFIDAALAGHSLQRSPPADPANWLRRVSFDLTGLPPSLDEVRDYVADHLNRGAAADAAVVERLLASPRHGERWAQHWLDVVRYADTDGFEVNTERPNAWPYRDYLIRSFNADIPYDQFIREQVAGDALGADAATGFLVTASVLLPGQVGKDEPSIRLARQDAIDEIVNNIGQSFLGLSVGCARCHDHMFDAITSTDYYSMQAFVAGVEYGEREIRSPDAADPDLQETAELTRIDQRLTELAIPAGNAAQATNPTRNVVAFPAQKAKFVRFTIHASNSHPTLGVIEPCIDEFEIFGRQDDGNEPRNLALAALGSRVSASGSRTSDIHRIEYIHDGIPGNSSSWMADTSGHGWVLFELPEATAISEIVWSRDRSGQFSDRLATVFTVEVGLSVADLTEVAGISAAHAREAAGLLEEKLALEARRNGDRQMVFAGIFRAPDVIHRLNRGDPEQPQELLGPAVIAALGDLQLPPDSPDQERRLALAHWLSSPQNPLPARVMVNRLWQGHFGVGLVETPSDFGRNGRPPSHPELLDWLAAEFIRSGWSIKHMHRLMVLSGTYRQTSSPATGGQRAAAVDAGARLLWRYPSRRLDAESIRDSMLMLSGELNLNLYGRGFDLFDQRGGLSGFQPVETFSGEGLRRLIYAHKIRRESDPVFGVFDCPDGGQSTARRLESTTPVQALNLFNSRFTLERAGAFAARVIAEVGEDPAAQVRRACEIALNRQPEPEEQREIEAIVRAHGLPTYCRALLNCNEFLYLP